MPSQPATAIRSLITDECWQRLADHPARIGRVGIGGPSPDILPVNYAVDRRSLVFRTAEGKKLLADLATGQPQPTWAKLMTKRHHKTLVVCPPCHDVVRTRQPTISTG